MIDDDEQGFHVPMRAVTVELALFGRAAERARVFVAAHDEGRATRHAVVALLEQEQPFVPTQADSDRTPQVINKDAILWIAVDSRAEDADEALLDYRHVVRVELVGGTPLAGELLYTLPVDHARLVDFLNGPGRFFRLWTGTRLYLINKGYVERVVEAPLDLDASGDGAAGKE
jgi:hypothetical protein